MRDFIPEGENEGSPIGKGGYRDFVPAEEKVEKVEVSTEKSEVVEEKVEKTKGPKRGKKHTFK